MSLVFTIYQFPHLTPWDNCHEQSSLLYCYFLKQIFKWDTGPLPSSILQTQTNLGYVRHSLGGDAYSLWNAVMSRTIFYFHPLSKQQSGLPSLPGSPAAELAVRWRWTVIHDRISRALFISNMLHDTCAGCWTEPGGGFIRKLFRFLHSSVRPDHGWNDRPGSHSLGVSVVS